MTKTLYSKSSSLLCLWSTALKFALIWNAGFLSQRTMVAVAHTFSAQDVSRGSVGRVVCRPKVKCTSSRTQLTWKKKVLCCHHRYQTKWSRLIWVWARIPTSISSCAPVVPTVSTLTPKEAGIIYWRAWVAKVCFATFAIRGSRVSNTFRTRTAMLSQICGTISDEGSDLCARTRVELAGVWSSCANIAVPLRMRQLL